MVQWIKVNVEFYCIKIFIRLKIWVDIKAMKVYGFVMFEKEIWQKESKKINIF